METAAVHGEPKRVRPDKELTIVICSADDDREFAFDRNTKVADVIAVAVKAFGLDPNDAYDLFLHKRDGGHGDGGNQNSPLPKDRPLGSFPEIHDGTKLILTSRGGGV